MASKGGRGLVAWLTAFYGVTMSSCFIMQTNSYPSSSPSPSCFIQHKPWLCSPATFLYGCPVASTMSRGSGRCIEIVRERWPEMPKTALKDGARTRQTR
eukprot:616565-Hanusia_phi.AAC.1